MIAKNKATVLLNTLRQCAMFRDLPSSDLESIAEWAHLRNLKKGECLFREKEIATGFYIVQSGAIEISRTSYSGKEIKLSVFRPFDSFAEPVLNALETYPANANALQTSQVVHIQKQGFRRLVRQNPDLALNILSSMSYHLKHMVKLLEEQKNTHIESRLADYLLKNIRGSADPVVRLDISKKNLASHLGVTSETFSRTLARFRKEGLIVVCKHEITLIDIQGLEAYLENERDYSI